MLPAQRNFITDKLFLLRLDRIFTQIKINTQKTAQNFNFTFYDVDLLIENKFFLWNSS